MCNAATCNDPFHGLDDDFLEDFGIEARDPSAPEKPLLSIVPAIAPAQVFEETCKKCHGRGTFIGYSGRVVGKCFTCKGTGKISFKQSPQVRAKAAQNRAKTKEQSNAALAAKISAWIAEHQAEWNWMLAQGHRFDFAKEMALNVTKRGGLTENQLAAVQRCMTRDEARKEDRAEREAKAVAVNIQPIVDAFAKAQANSIKRPQMRLGDFRFSLAPASGANAGAIYVKTADRDYLGKIVNGKLIRGRDCSAEQEAAIVELCANPAESAVAYGRRTGNCAICGRELTKGESIDRGIGPICADNYGF